MDVEKYTDKKKPTTGFKKATTSTMASSFDPDPQQDAVSTGSQYLILPEYKSERIYSELLTKIMTYEESLRSIIGAWREHAGFLEKFAQTIHLFHMPEMHDLFAPVLFKLIQNGTSVLREAVSKCIVEMLIN
jgi:hypothetical protein